MIRIQLSGIGIYGRNTQGLKLINLSEGSKVTKVTLVNHEEEEVEEVDIVNDQGIAERIEIEANEKGEVNVHEENVQS